MTIISKIWTTTLLIIIFATTSQANTTNLPAIKQIELSPDGNKMLMLRAIENNYYAFAINLKNKKIILLWHRILAISL